MNQERLTGTAKKLDRLLKFVQVINCAAAVLVLCGVLILSIAYWVNPGSVNATEVISVDLGEVTLELANAESRESGIDLSYAWVNSVFLVILLTILWAGFRCARNIMVPMMEGNPFDISVSKNFMKLSRLSLRYGIAGNLGSIIMTHMKMEHYQLERLVDSKHILSVIPQYQLELGFMVVFFVFLLASYIFRYGAELQQLSDETL